ncbi:hypothetical protein [Streptomyces sp. NPDC001307]|uniref:hypothetical protein n=1 Tax=Streptomyces sp. NPDC001307 TaxID=3364560 RepID=UPI003695D576
MLALGDEPGQGDLGRGGADAVGDLADLGRDVEVGPQVVLLEAGQTPALVVGARSRAWWMTETEVASSRGVAMS